MLFLSVRRRRSPSPGAAQSALPGLRNCRPLRARSPDKCAASPPGVGLHAITRLLNQLRHLWGDLAVPHRLPRVRLNLSECDADRALFTVQMADQHLGNVGGQRGFCSSVSSRGKHLISTCGIAKTPCDQSHNATTEWPLWLASRALNQLVTA